MQAQAEENSAWLMQFLGPSKETAEEEGAGVDEDATAEGEVLDLQPRRLRPRFLAGAMLVVTAGGSVEVKVLTIVVEYSVAVSETYS